MKDIPVFTTENGVASLFLREISYKGIARIKIISSITPKLLLEECVAFCRACGAEEIHGSGDACLEEYQFVTSILEMSIDPAMLSPTDAMLFPLQEHTVSQWCEIANNKLANVDNAAYMTLSDGNRIAKNGSGYFVHREGKLLGIGCIEDDSIALVASVSPGGGEHIVRALTSLLPEGNVRLTVASTNRKAIALYERLGFLVVREISKWYKII